MRLARRRDRIESTYATPLSGRLAGYLTALPAIDPDRSRDLARLVARYLEHRFDVLGSGWLQVSHGLSCPGLEGSRFAAGPSVDADTAGRWLEGRLNRGNVEPARRIWSLVDPEYVPIDWQLDIRSGFRWSERTWYRDIAFGNVRGQDIKVPWELARMQHLPQLALASGLARDGRPGFDPPGRYEREFRNTVLDFIATNPPRFGVNWVIAMEVAIRVCSWLVAWDLFMAAGSEFDDDFARVFAASVSDHGRFIADNLEWVEEIHGNHYLADVAGLLFVGAYLPRSQETDGWLAFAVRELLLEIDHQFWPDGANFEASTCYHRLSAEIVTWSVGIVLALSADRLGAFGDHPPLALGAARPLTADPIPVFHLRSGPARPIPPWLPPQLQKMAAFSRHVTKPSGLVAQIGDNDSGRFLKLFPARVEGRDESLDHRPLIGAIDALFGDTDPEGPIEGHIMRVLVGDHRLDREAGAEQQPFGVDVGSDHDWRAFGHRLAAARPDRRRIVRIPIADGGALDGAERLAYPRFGFWLFRSRRLWLATRCGSIGQQGFGGHAHNDQLSVELAIDGVDCLRDPGTYVYTPLPDRRNAYRSQAAHAGPRFTNGEPARLDIDLFVLGAEAVARCSYWGPNGFAGEWRSSGGRTLCCRVTVSDDAIEVSHWAENADLDGPHGEWADWRVLVPRVPFSPGYGVLEAE
jgi:hypothetical protein